MNSENEPEILPYTKKALKITTIVSIVVYLGILGVHCYNRNVEKVPVQQEQIAPSQLELETADSLYISSDSTLHFSSPSDGTTYPFNNKL